MHMAEVQYIYKAYIFGVILDAMVQYEYTSNVAGCELHLEEEVGDYLGCLHRRIIWLVQEGVCFWQSSLLLPCFLLFFASFSRSRSTGLQGRILMQLKHVRKLAQVIFSGLFLPLSLLKNGKAPLLCEL